MNGKRMGGGFYTAPKGDPSDGQFDLCIASEAGRMRIFGLIPHFLKGTQDSQPEIHMDRTDRITIGLLRGFYLLTAMVRLLCRRDQLIEIIPAPWILLSAPQVDLMGPMGRSVGAGARFLLRQAASINRICTRFHPKVR
jgi:hypothetical protein